MKLAVVVVVVVVVVVAVVTLTACTARTARDAVTEAASADLACSDLDLEISVIGSSSGSDQPTIVDYRVTGCRQTARYKCEDDHQSPEEVFNCTLEAHTTVTAMIAIDGAALVPDGANLCRSGVAEGQAFFGVDLTAADGTALRIQRNPDLSFGVIAMPAAAAPSPLLEGCTTATIATDPQAGISGTATFACASAPWSVTGSVTFAQCE